jgi:flavodoxin short chain
MGKVAIVYWSGTGNTEKMAVCAAEGARAEGAEVAVFTAGEFSKDRMDDFDAIAFGCPSMGAEELEENEFEPMFSGCRPKLNGKRIALFGSYGWGDGEWMRTWEEDCRKAGAVLVCDCVICNEAPDAEAQEACRSMGRALTV